MSRSILVSDPGGLIAQYREAVLDAMARVVDSRRFILGEEVERFEGEFARWIGTRHGIGVASGTDAVAIALGACGVGPGDAVFTVANTAVATAAAIVSTGATPVFVDIDPLTHTMSPHHLEAAVGEFAHAGRGLRPAAVVAVHLYGRPAAMTSIVAICRDTGLRLVEDAAQAHGAAIAGRRVGTFGDAAAFSFYPTKNLGAIGDAGIVLTSNDGVADEARLLRQYGWRQRYVSERVGRNSRLDELQAAVLHTLLPHLEGWNQRRMEIAERYTAGLQAAAVDTPTTTDSELHVYHQYVVECADRGRLSEHLAAAGIGTSVLYPVPIHQQPAYHGAVVATAGLSATEAAAGRILSLPMGPHLSDADVDSVIAEVVRFR